MSDNTFIQIAKRHNEKFGSNYPINKSEIELFFFPAERAREIGEAVMAQLVEQMKARLMAEDPSRNRNADQFYFRFLTGVIVLGVTIASIVRATK